MTYCAYLNIIEMRLLTIMKSSRQYIVFSRLYSKIPKGVILHRVKSEDEMQHKATFHAE